MKVKSVSVELIFMSGEKKISVEELVKINVKCGTEG